ncbi:MULTISPECIES: hypothetical protein [Staphylococcus]|uniref:Uncharacterized protein n=2 Tax=Staphylococcus TaxID=1279 RepID=A0ABX3Z211_9STAP|nr:MULTISPECIES: hypothetical protein [Staphylococcus]AJC95787.1 hypothetical protein SHYC_05145 [Staphylococcus hyicus]MDG4943932.1 hypothetical protein [Staphylococcus agnetis]MDP4462604.1 hypothetical protein [Staphylococcus hyicus]OSP22587.1 hypothetical protein B9L42_00475 [Staphylococcus agnetis]OSP23122.1 hypothetical protein B9M87_09320 [Staphylococcus agnetis]
MVKVDFKKIWQDWKKRRISNYILVHENAKISEEMYFLIERNKLAFELREMDRLDGTNEFENLLYDLESFNNKEDE